MNEDFAANGGYIQFNEESGLTLYEKGDNWLMQELYKRGVWAIRSGWNHSALQFKAGLLMDEKLAQETLNILDDALTACDKIYNK